MKQICLVDVTKDNWERICFLYPGEAGREFVASNSFSIAQSVYEDRWTIKGIQLEDALIGFAMYGLSTDVDGYELCRFMLDEAYQGKGYGKRALDVIVSEMFRAFSCDRVYLSTVPNNERGKHIYQSAGFVPTGETCGDGDDVEDVYVLIRK